MSIAVPARHCLELAASAAPAMLGRVIDVAVADMQEAETRLIGPQRQDMADAWLQLLQSRVSWCEQYPSRLRAAFAAPVADAPATATPTANRKQTLALVDDESVVQAIEAAR